MWEFSDLESGKALEDGAQKRLSDSDPAWAHLGQTTESLGSPEVVEELLSSRQFKEASGLRGRPGSTV